MPGIGVKSDWELRNMGVGWITVIGGRSDWFKEQLDRKWRDGSVEEINWERKRIACIGFKMELDW